MSSDEDFISKVVTALDKSLKETKRIPSPEGMERQFRRLLAQHLFEDVLGWKGYCYVAEILDITCFDDEKFPVIVVETKAVDLTREHRRKLKSRIEELRSVKWGVLTNLRKFMIYKYEPYKLMEFASIDLTNIPFVVKGEWELSDKEKRQILRLKKLGKEYLVKLEDPEYFESTYKEVSVAKPEGTKLLIENLKEIVRDLTSTMIDFFEAYQKREEYSGRFLQRQFNDWLKHSMKDEEFKEGDEEERRKIIEVFCRETAYVLVGRILFIRICEDKEILKPLNLSGEGLAESLRFYERKKWKNPYLLAFNGAREEIKKYYSHLHELGFFDWWWISPEKIGLLSYDDRRIQDSLEEDLNYHIKKCLRRLNRFDFTQVNRDILGDVYQGYLPPDERKRLGEFYTPKEVIEYILDAVGYKPEDEIRGKKILDPACGSGSFLVEATQRLMERYRRIGFSLKNPDDAKQIIDGCINSIHGLDIHPFACFIAEMNLLFQLVDLYDVVRQKDRYYELPRLKIYRTDSLAPSGEPIELTEFFDNSRRKMRIEETKGADKIKSFKFDYVVGNPPYVRKERIPAEYKEKILAETYPEVYQGDNDICVYFITKGIGWLNDQGRFGYIVSGKFTKTRYGKKLRKYIPSTCCIAQFLDLRGVKVFREVTNDPIILILNKEPDAQKRSSQQVIVVNVKREKETATGLIEYIKEKVKEEYSDEYIDIFKTKQSFLGEKVWKVVPIKCYELLEKIMTLSNFSLGSLCGISRGIETGRNISKDGKPVFIFDSKKELSSNLERKLLKPLVKGKDIEKWLTFHEGRWIIYTVHVKDENDLRTNFPHIFKHLFEYHDELVYKHKGGRDRHPEGRASELMRHKEWYELRKPLNPEMLEIEKILTRRITTEHCFVYDNKGLYPLETCCVIVPQREYKSIKFTKLLIGLLNSKTIEFALKLTSRYLGKQGFEYEKQYLDRLPIKLPQIDWEKRIADEIIKSVDQILQLKEQSYLSKDRLRTFPYSYFEDGWSFDKLTNIAKVHLSKSSYKISEKTIRTYSFKELEYPLREVSRIILATKEHIDFYSEEVASYVFEVLKTMNRITKRELLELKMPTEEHLKNLMNQYRKDKEQIVKNEKEVKELEKQIDDLVYKLYDISYRERRIIEDYLAKF